jgi:hypothetical protein
MAGKRKSSEGEVPSEAQGKKVEGKILYQCSHLVNVYFASRIGKLKRFLPDDV